MKNIQYCISILLIGLGAISCQPEKGEADYPFTNLNVGALYLGTPEINEDIPTIITRSADFSMLDKNKFIIEIQGTGSSNGSTFKRFETYTQLEEYGMPLELPVGPYLVRAFSYDPADVLREQPYFLGKLL